MTGNLPFVLIPGLNCSRRLYQHQIPALEKLGAVTVADHTSDETIPAIAERALKVAPERFQIVALSMGGYIAFEILRQASSRVEKVALLDTSARADLPQHTERRLKLIAMAESGKFGEVNDMLFPLLVHPDSKNDARLRRIVDQMAEEVGPSAFVRQQKALMARKAALDLLPGIKQPVLVMVGDADKLIPPEQSEEIANGIPGARLEYVKQSGHLSTLEQPEAVARSLVNFFGS